MIETGIPHLRYLPPGQDILGYRAGPGRMVSYSFDHATQQYRGHYVKFTDGTGEYRTIPFRYVWPSELDLMAQLAGLRLRDRWAGWNREPSLPTAARTSRSGRSLRHIKGDPGLAAVQVPPTAATPLDNAGPGWTAMEFGPAYDR